MTADSGLGCSNGIDQLLQTNKALQLHPWQAIPAPLRHAFETVTSLISSCPRLTQRHQYSDAIQHNDQHFS